MDDHERIRAVFLDRQESYSGPEATRLLGTTWSYLLDRIVTGEIEATQRVLYSDIPWDDVVRLLMERVPLTTIYAALGDRADEVLPSLLRLERLDIPVPAYVIRAVEWAAQKRGVTFEQYLHGELFDLVESIWSINPAIDKVPGIVEALFFPDDPPARGRNR